MQSMWTVEALARELQHVSKNIAARSNPEVASALIKNMIFKLGKLGNIDSGNCLSLYQAVEASGLMAEHRALCCAAIDAKMLESDPESGAASGGYGQKLEDCTNWLTQTDWYKIEDPSANDHSIQAQCSCKREAGQLTS